MAKKLSYQEKVFRLIWYGLIGGGVIVGIIVLFTVLGSANTIEIDACINDLTSVEMHKITPWEPNWQETIPGSDIPGCTNTKVKVLDTKLVEVTGNLTDFEQIRWFKVEYNGYEGWVNGLFVNADSYSKPIFIYREE